MTTLAAPTTRRPIWQIHGGGDLVVGAALLLVATLLEYPLLTDSTDRGPLFWGFVVTFVLSLVAYAAAMFALAFGSKGDDGIVGRSVLGRAALIGFGIFWFAAQLVYLLSHYFTAPGSDFAAANAAAIVLVALTYVSAVVAGIVIVRARVATGFARWSLLLLMIVAAVCGGIANAVGSPEVVTVAYSLSTVAQLLIGVSYLANRRARESALA
jgi:hypothetical protein